jgi:hypothetical protein
MKTLLLLCSLLILTASTCKNKKTMGGTCFKGRLEVKAACMNYTISVVSGNMDTSRIVANWTDESTGESYKNAFALDSRCTFPSTINEGDEFYFMIDSSSVQNCAVCMMYYPVPAKKLAIKIIQEPCGQ